MIVQIQELGTPFLEGNLGSLPTKEVGSRSQ
jgi:hypothetical protein